MSRAGKVLIVENDPDTQQLLWAVAMRSGFFPLVAEDGRAAIVELSRSEFDVVLLDLLLPEVNGFEVLRHLACVMPQLLERVIIVTGADEEMYKDCKYLESIFCLLPKPVDVEVLADLMLECFGERMRIAVRKPARRVDRPTPVTEQRQSAS